MEGSGLLVNRAPICSDLWGEVFSPALHIQSTTVDLPIPGSQVIYKSARPTTAAVGTLPVSLGDLLWRASMRDVL